MMRLLCRVSRMWSSLTTSCEFSGRHAPPSNGGGAQGSFRSRNYSQSTGGPVGVAERWSGTSNQRLEVLVLDGRVRFVVEQNALR